MKILLTGFDPFDREKVNPAFEAVKLLPDTIAGAQIVKLEVPTQFVRASEALEAAMAGVTAGSSSFMLSVMVRGMSRASMEKEMNVAEETVL